MKEVKPCPFCGHDDLEILSFLKEPHIYCLVQCSFCLVRGPKTAFCPDFFKSDNDHCTKYVFKNWNERHVEKN